MDAHLKALAVFAFLIGVSILFAAYPNVVAHVFFGGLTLFMIGLFYWSLVCMFRR